ncbi:uncharacterized protein METZ01_LOCUS455040 [marine metagenome]|uniref:Uncharacterized protein n=1 Tax=marine metagenome TaxID=408172 RepID=A0A383A2R3_9ZZZZ
MIERMGLNPTTGRLQTILSSNGEQETLEAKSSLEVLSHIVRIDRASIDFRTSADSFARLAYGFYSDLDIRHNNKEVDYFRTADGFIGLRIPAGENTIEISGRLSLLRRRLLITNMILLFGAIYWLNRGHNPPFGRSNGRKVEHPVSA